MVVAIYAGACADTTFTNCPIASVEYPIYGISPEGGMCPKNVSLTGSANDTCMLGDSTSGGAR